MENTSNEKYILEDIVNQSLLKLYENDKYLIDNGLHEQCVCFRFGLYLHDLLMQYGFDEYTLDAEYNKNMDREKWLQSWPKGARPDFILHKRGENQQTNILVLEFKKGKRPRVTQKDEQKIKEFMRYPYYYKYGATILLTPNSPKIQWI